MTNGFSPFNYFLAAFGGVFFSSIIFSLYFLSAEGFSWQIITFATAFLIPASLAVYFMVRHKSANLETDLLRSSLISLNEKNSEETTKESEDLKMELKRTQVICERLTAGDFEARIINIDENKAISGLQNAINDFVDRMDAFMREASASMEHVAEQKYYRRIIEIDMGGIFLGTASTINLCTGSFAKRTADFDAVIQQFKAQIGTVSHSIFETSESLQKSARTLSANADTTNTHVVKVSQAAEAASSSVQIAAISANEMTSSIQEISSQVHHSLTNAKTAQEVAQIGNAKIKGLAEAAQSIGEVVKLIEDIAGQTNLLALNATIEAARAGEAGKGFAVVAGEVKNLASQTARATEDITKHIVEIQDATSEAVQSMETINSTVNDINGSVSAIASAVDQQKSATQGIAENVQSASSNTQSVSTHISGVQSSAKETSQTSSGLLKEANILQDHSEGLEKNVANFLTKVKSVV
ncbi:MAG: hypothetical protein JKY12_04340 [Sneathiella sp.]|nr:hypothetical protein [Sneathiella sp.]